MFQALWILAFLTGCMRLEVAPAVQAGIATEAPAGLTVVFEGEKAHLKDWVRAYAVSRIWSRSVLVSGSVSDLLTPGLLGFFQAHRVAAGRFVVRIDRLDTHWVPPKEFIQTPKAREMGTVRMHFVFSWEWGDDDRETGGKRANAGVFEIEKEARVFPGEEKAMLELLIHRELTGFLQHLEEKCSCGRG